MNKLTWIYIVTLSLSAVEATDLKRNLHNRRKRRRRRGCRKSIAKIVTNTPQFSTLADLLKLARLDDNLNQEGPFTVFAPTNDAFDQLPKSMVDDLKNPNNRNALIDILSYHVVSGVARAKDLKEGQKVETLEGSTVSVSLDPKVSINNALVIQVDQPADNGIIHVIGNVLLPPKLVNIAQILMTDEKLSILFGLLEDANLLDLLEGDGPFTLFAPMNKAFDNFLDEVEDETDVDDIDIITDILTYHVATEKLLSKNLNVGQEIGTATAKGDTIEVTSINPPRFNNANTIAYDIVAKNGVIHIIDAVMQPDDDVGARLNTNCGTSSMCMSECCAQTWVSGNVCMSRSFFRQCV